MTHPRNFEKVRAFSTHWGLLMVSQHFISFDSVSPTRGLSAYEHLPWLRFLVPNSVVKRTFGNSNGQSFGTGGRRINDYESRPER